MGLLAGTTTALIFPCNAHFSQEWFGSHFVKHLMHKFGQHANVTSRCQVWCHIMWHDVASVKVSCNRECYICDITMSSWCLSCATVSHNVTTQCQVKVSHEPMMSHNMTSDPMTWCWVMLLWCHVAWCHVTCYATWRHITPWLDTQQDLIKLPTLCDTTTSYRDAT